MLGNVFEWCHDGRRHYESKFVIDPVGSTDAGPNRVIRGGDWGRDAQVVRAAYRVAVDPGIRYLVIGFRCLSSAREPGSGGP